MRYWALDILACVYCKHHPLKLVVFKKEEEDVETEDIPIPYCKTYCGYLGEKIVKEKEYPCRKCLRIEVIEGILYCPNCLHWYPIKNGIVIMLPDDKRRKESDLEFLRKYKDKVPREILEEGKPYSLYGDSEDQA